MKGSAAGEKDIKSCGGGDLAEIDRLAAQKTKVGEKTVIAGDTAAAQK